MTLIIGLIAIVVFMMLFAFLPGLTTCLIIIVLLTSVFPVWIAVLMAAVLMIGFAAVSS